MTANHHVEDAPRAEKGNRPSVSAASHQRASLLAASAVLYPVIFASFLLFEKPGLGLGHFY